jgi:hypothetical protein
LKHGSVQWGFEFLTGASAWLAQCSVPRLNLSDKKKGENMSKSILIVYYLSRKEKMCKEGIDTVIFDCEVRKGSKRLGSSGNHGNHTISYHIWLNCSLFTGCYHASP